MSDYNKYRNKAREKITQYGNPITLIHEGEKVYNPSSNEYEGSEERIQGVALQLTYSTRFVDGNNIKMGDIKFMAVLDIKPITDDKLEYNGKTYTIVSIKEVNPNGEEPIYYDIQAR